MIALTSTVRKLKVKLGGAIATEELPIIVQFRDDREERIRIAFGSTNKFTTGTTAVQVLDPPRPGITRLVSALQIYNKDTAVSTVNLIYDNAGIEYIMAKMTLDIGDLLIYEDRQGFYVIAKDGNIKLI